MAAETSTSCFSFLARIPKILAPCMLFAVVGILSPAVRFVYVNPLTAEISRHLSEMAEHTEPSSAEHARLVEETRHDATQLFIISIALTLITLTLAFGKQVVARFFAASSTASSSGPGERYSLAELLREVTKWHNMRAPLVTTAALVTVVQLAYMTLVVVDSNSATGMRDYWFLSVRGSLFLAAFLAILYFGVLALMGAAVGRKEWSVLVMLTLLLPALLIPVCGVVVLYLYTEQVMGLGLSLLSVYDILQGVQDLLCLSAANVYCYYS